MAMKLIFYCPEARSADLPLAPPSLPPGVGRDFSISGCPGYSLIRRRGKPSPEMAGSPPLFFQTFFECLLVRCICPFPIPTWHQKAHQNPSWCPSFFHHFFDAFLNRFLLDFRFQLASQNPPKSFKNRCQDAFPC